ncbi:leucine--tRNA ligase [Reinekea sp.]|uniref:leucine--tRNA ligase n=1 Tax=Reinekea sp. TaxID=1970455 RepID=UPI00257B2420|nr:leucine--tRNA ligase [Reinekea sp.]MDO7641277.1 leucine--tRNA ligase [Reinekea forsetii]MDO7643519.1 leucine--tRNA ligase [Reinekea forsetii]
METSYVPAAIERSVQQVWAQKQVFKAVVDTNKEKYYCLSMLPYPSGALHMGHVRNYTIGDVISRFQRMLGKNVIQPMGWDAFGMPAENAAIKHGVAPAKWTLENIDYMRTQLKSLGFAYDWEREVTTCKPEYYRWEQWFFTRLMAKDMAYKKSSFVNWCPHDMTVLANEQVHDGCCWRCDTPVERKEMEQWFVRTTAYAEELLSELDNLPGWPEEVKAMQRNWIGKSRGVNLQFAVQDSPDVVEVYTTRPDTLMGVTYLAVASAHPLATAAAQSNPALAQFIDECRQSTTSEANMATMEKRGCATGQMAIHPLTGKAVPIWAANFVLMDYGTGAVMAVPAHDQRDWEFARKYGLAIEQVVAPLADSAIACDIELEAFTEKGQLVHSGEFDGLTFEAAFDAIAAVLVAQNKGSVATNYRLRDWGVSRQRYWGTPVPVVYVDGVAKPAEQFPVELPYDVTIDGINSPIKNNPEFEQTTWQGQPALRETDTFDTFMESSWYYARYCTPHYDEGMLEPEEANYWLPVDQYIGGIEHATMHLMYARFFHKALRDEGLVNSNEPFTRLLCQGMVLAETWYRLDGTTRVWINPDAVTPERDEQGRIVAGIETATGAALIYAGMAKMSKSKMNGKDPQQAIDLYGADTVRLFSMFAAPPEQTLEWTEAGVQGAKRFLERVWRAVHQLVSGDARVALDPSHLTAAEKTLRRKTHETIEGITLDFGERKTFNTAIAKTMELLNAVNQFTGDGAQSSAVVGEALQAIVVMLSPIVPHISQRLWQELGQDGLIIDAAWPTVDQSALVKDTLLYVVQVNGKVRARLEVPASMAKDEVEVLALSDEHVMKFLEGVTIRKVIVIPNKLINIVAN